MMTGAPSSERPTVSSTESRDHEISSRSELERSRDSIEGTVDHLNEAPQVCYGCDRIIEDRPAIDVDDQGQMLFCHRCAVILRARAALCDGQPSQR